MDDLSYPSVPLAVEQYQSLRAWALKTYLVLTFIEAGLRDVAKGADLKFIPNFTRARLLYDGDEQAFDGLTIGLAAGPDEGRLAHVFGNPTVRPTGPRYANCRSVGSAIITLGRLQLWVVDPLLPGAAVALPDGVRSAASGVAFANLRKMPLIPSMTRIVVVNPEHDIAELIGRLTELLPPS